MRTRIPCPPVVVYKAIDPAPLGHEYLAWFFLEGFTKGKDGLPDRAVYGRLPVFLNSSTEDRAAQKAVEFWDREQDRLDRVWAKSNAASERMRK